MAMLFFKRIHIRKSGCGRNEGVFNKGLLTLNPTGTAVPGEVHTDSKLITENC